MVGDLFVVAVIRVWDGVVLCRVSLLLAVGVGLVVFKVECVLMLVMVDNGWGTVENMVDVMVFVECCYLV